MKNEIPTGSIIELILNDVPRTEFENPARKSCTLKSLPRRAVECVHQKAAVFKISQYSQVGDYAHQNNEPADYFPFRIKDQYPACEVDDCDKDQKEQE